MKLSICCITYQHEEFIAETIQGFLMQQTDFDFEIIIGEDNSKDKTLNIIESFNKKFSKKIKLFSNENNKGMIENFIQTIERCTGKYIALCEGDDYWTDPLKLQKQVDFLESNPDYNLCFHKVRFMKNGVLQNVIDVAEKRFESITNNPIGIVDLLEKGNFIHTPSVVFRNNIIEFPLEFRYSLVGDYFMYILILNQGFIKRIDEYMAVYRIGSGLYSSLDLTDFEKNKIIYQSCILSYLSNNYHKKILLENQIKLINSSYHRLKRLEKRNKYEMGFKKMFKYLFYKIKSKFVQ